MLCLECLNKPLNAVDRTFYDAVKFVRRGFLGIVAVSELTAGNVKEMMTELEKLKISLLKCQKRLALVEKVAGVGHWEWDLLFDRIAWSEQSYKVFGYQPGQIEMNLASVMDTVSEEDKARVEEAVRAALEDDEPYTIEFRAIGADGAERLIHSRGEVFRSDTGKPIKMIGACQDVTELKRAEETLQQSEEKWRLLAENLSNGFVSQDENYIFTYVNSKLCSMTGYSPEEMVGKSIWDFVADEDREILAAQIKQRKKGGEGDYELNLARKDGALIPSIISPTPLFDAEGNFKGSFASVTDISELKNSENALRDSLEKIEEKEALLRLQRDFSECIIETAQTIILVLDEKGLIIRFNPYMEQISGYCQEEVKGRDWFETFLPETDRRSLRQLFQRAIGDIQTKGNINPIITKSGEKLDIEWYDKTLKNSKGEVIGLLAIGQDITERLKAENELKKSEDRFRIAFDHAAAGIAWLDLKGKFLKVNEHLCEMLGYSENELLARDFRSITHHGDIEAGLRDFKRMINGDFDHAHFEKRYINKNGDRVWAAVSPTIIRNEAGEPQYFMTIIQNITAKKKTEQALKESEESYRTLAENLPAIVYRMFLEEKNRIIFFNDMTEPLTGYKSSELELGNPCCPFMNLMADDDHAQAYEIINAGIRTGKPFELEYKIRAKDGSVKHFHEHGRAIFSEGKPFCIDGAIFDETSKIEADEEQNKLKDQLARAHQMEAVGTLAGGIAHDFNNILSAIFGYTEMALNDAPNDGAVRQDLAEIIKAGNRAKDLVRQILSFSRQKEQELRPVRIQNIAQEALKLLRASIPTTIQFQADIDKGCGPIRADPTQMHQIFMNLGTNAYHAMMKTGGILSVSIKQITLAKGEESAVPDLPPAAYVAVNISDTGCGMDSATLRKAFDPYFTTKQKGVGTGLGLAVVHGIVKSCGGEINVVSKVGEGTSFEIYLPIIDTASQTVLPKEISEPIIGGNEKLLVIDDEAAIAVMIAANLRRLGYNVETKSSSVEALKMITAKPDSFDLVVTDMTMPAMNGAELARALLDIRPEFPIVLCTGFSELIDEDKAKSIGISQYILKPILTMELAAAIRKALNKR